jgi:formate C-acetyltransferase/4-hydroxyphenylacetate decarboxylase large subunit
VARGRSLDDRGARYNHSPTTLSSGMVNVANSLAAVHELVDRQKLLTLQELRTALDADWRGHDLLRRRALDAPKFGNDEAEVDDVVRELFDAYIKLVLGQRSFLGEPYDPSMLSISTHTPFGKACGATPDGRRAGEPLADAVLSPMPGTDRCGPTGVVLSATKIDCTPMRGGQLNLKLHPTALWGAEGAQKLLALCKTYFDLGGPHVQFNVVDTRMLEHAREHPELYRDLLVRVAGFSAYWVELSPSLQDQIIARTEHGL